MNIRTMRASGARIIVEVGIGEADNGSYVTATTVLDRTSQEVKDALIPIENLALRITQDRMAQAKVNVDINAKVAERIAKKLEPERKRLKERHDRDVMDMRTVAQREVVIERDKVAKLSRDLEASQRNADQLRERLQGATQARLAAEERVVTLEANEHDRQAAQ